MRDRIAINNNGIRAVAEGNRVVKNGAISINGREYWGNCLADIEGQTVFVRVRDSLASVYSVYDYRWNSLGECHEPSRFERRAVGEK